MYSVNLENTYQTGSENLSAVEQFELLGALVEVVTQGDAVAPAVDLPALGPELNVNRVAGLEHPAKGADVFDLFFRGDMADSSCKRLRPKRRRCQEQKNNSIILRFSFRKIMELCSDVKRQQSCYISITKILEQ